MRALLVNPPLPEGSGNLVRDLVYGCWCGGKRVGGIAFPPVPQAQLAAVLTAAGVPARVVDAPAEGLSGKDMLALVAPGDLLLCMVSPLSAALDLRFLAEAHGAGARTALYGAFPTFQPEEAMRDAGIDFIVRGEPEEAVASLARALTAGDGDALAKIPGVGFRRPDGSVVLPDRAADPPDLDTLPFPDRTLIPPPGRYFNPVVRDRRFTTAFTSRGCFGHCTFCSSAGFYGGKVRYRSAESVLAELEIVRSQGFREVFFRDELFTGDPARLEAICGGMRAGRPRLSWVCSTRVDLIDPAKANSMKAAGCHLVRMGVESGSPAVLARIRKGITVEKTRMAFAACRDAGLDTHAHTMVGLPGETREDFRMTLALVREIRPTYLTTSICTPFPGTALHDALPAEGYGREDYFGDSGEAGLHSRAVHNRALSAMSPEEVEACVREAYRAFYLNPATLARQARLSMSPSALARRLRAGLRVLGMVAGGR